MKAKSVDRLVCLPPIKTVLTRRSASVEIRYREFGQIHRWSVSLRKAPSWLGRLDVVSARLVGSLV